MPLVNEGMADSIIAEKVQSCRYGAKALTSVEHCVNRLSSYAHKLFLGDRWTERDYTLLAF
jgi:hypothetical protein